MNQQYEVIFYDMPDGREPAIDFINDQSVKMASKILWTIDLLEEKNNVKKSKNNSKKKDTKNNSKKKDRKDRNSQNIIITSDFNTINNIKKSFNPIQNSKNNSRNDKKDLLLNIDSKMKTNNKNINVLQKEKNIQKNEKKKDKDLQTFYNFQKTDLGIKSKHKKFIKTNTLI